MILQSCSYSFDLFHPLCPCQKSIKTQNFPGFVLSRRKRKRLLSTTGQTSFRRCSFRLYAFSGDCSRRNLNVDVATSAKRGAKNFVFKRISNELEGDEVVLDSSSQLGSNFTSFQEDPIVDKLRTQLGVIHPIPSPPINRNIVGLFVLFFFVGVVFDKVWTWRRTDKVGSDERRRGVLPQLPSSFSLLLEKDLQRKESVEWVNMVLGKLWKVYRGGIENWIVGLLQPVIDNLKKPEYVQRVEIKQFSLGEEQLSVRNVERRTSRRVNDLQYQIGLRYTGGARMLLMLSLRFGIIPIVVPVGIRDFDIDGELWVKLRLIPTEPWVGAVSWAFVSLPKIKFELSPFRLFNLMAIPVLSMFLRKLLTEDLPRLFVRPKKIVLDFQKGKAVGPVSIDFKSGEAQEGNKDFVGELSVTVVDARKLPYLFFGKTDPYVILSIGDQIIRSKKNSQTTVFGPPGSPIWNQDFHMLVGNPRKQKLNIQVKDSLGFADFTVGAGEVDLTSLKDTVPTDRIVVLRGSLGLLSGGYSGEILVRLTYKAYVEDEEDENAGVAVPEADGSDYESDIDEPNIMNNERTDNSTDETDKESFMDVLAALIVSEEFQGIVASETGYNKIDDISTRGSTLSGLSPDPQVQTVPSSSNDAGITRGSALFWLAVLSSISVLIALNIGGSSIFNP